MLLAGTNEKRTPASDVFERAVVVDWSRSPYVKGCYSHPSVGAPMIRVLKLLAVPERVAIINQTISDIIV